MFWLKPRKKTAMEIHRWRLASHANFISSCSRSASFLFLFFFNYLDKLLLISSDAPWVHISSISVESTKMMAEARFMLH